MGNVQQSQMPPIPAAPATHLHDNVTHICKQQQQAKFSEIIDMTDQFEGSVIRTIRRLEELLRQLISACEAIGSLELSEKFKQCRTAIKRDIVFAASLYL